MLLLHLLFAMRTDENKWSCGSREEELLKNLKMCHRCVSASASGSRRHMYCELNPWRIFLIVEKVQILHVKGHII